MLLTDLYIYVYTCICYSLYLYGFAGVYESMKMDLFGNGTNMYVDGGTLENFPVQYFDGEMSIALQYDLH